MLNPTLLLGLLLATSEAPQVDTVCWIDPMTGRPYLAKCEKVKKTARPPVAEKSKDIREPSVKADE